MWTVKVQWTFINFTDLPHCSGWCWIFVVSEFALVFWLSSAQIVACLLRACMCVVQQVHLSWHNVFRLLMQSDLLLCWIVMCSAIALFVMVDFPFVSFNVVFSIRCTGLIVWKHFWLSLPLLCCFSLVELEYVHVHVNLRVIDFQFWGAFRLIDARS